jgi:hypothetical protein
VALLAGAGLTGCENLGHRAAEAVTQPGRQDHHRPSGATHRSARAFVRKTFVLYDRGRARRACAFSESPAYLAVDRSCARESARSVAQLHAAGVSAVPKIITTHLTGTRGTATLWWVVQGQRASIFVYLRYDGHRWWMTGERKTGDRGL